LAGEPGRLPRVAAAVAGALIDGLHNERRIGWPWLAGAAVKTSPSVPLAFCATKGDLFCQPAVAAIRPDATAAVKRFFNDFDTHDKRLRIIVYSFEHIPSFADDPCSGWSRRGADGAEPSKLKTASTKRAACTTRSGDGGTAAAYRETWCGLGPSYLTPSAASGWRKTRLGWLRTADSKL